MRSRMTRSSRAVTALSAAMLMGAVLTGCTSGGGGGTVDLEEYSAEWRPVVEAALEEGAVTVSAQFSPDTIEKLTAEFQTTYPGIQANLIRPTNSVEGATLITEELNQDSLSFDVVVNAQEPFIEDLVARGEALDLSIAPSAELWDAEHLKDGVILDAFLQPFVIPYNTELVTDPPTTFEELYSDEYKGKFGSFANPGSVPATAFDEMRTELLGQAWMSDLAALDPKFYPAGDTAIAQAVASGEIGIADFGFASSIEPLKAQGAPVDYVILDEGTIGYSYKSITFKNGPSPNAGLLFMDFVMSEKGQEIIAGGGLAGSWLGVDGAMELDLDKIIQPTADQGSAERIDAAVNEWRTNFGGN